MPQANAERVLFGLIVTLGVALIAAWVVDPRLHRDERRQSEQFQQLVRGFGLGTSLDLSAREFVFHVCRQPAEIGVRRFSVDESFNRDPKGSALPAGKRLMA